MQDMRRGLEVQIETSLRIPKLPGLGPRVAKAWKPRGGGETLQVIAGTTLSSVGQSDSSTAIAA